MWQFPDGMLLTYYVKGEIVQFTFDSAGIKPSTGSLEPIPTGNYNVVIVDSGKELNSTKDGSYLWFELKVTDGPMMGRTLRDQLNVENRNAKAVEIAMGELAAYCHVTGKYKFSDTAELQGIPFKAQLGPQRVKNDKGEYVDSDKYSEVKYLMDKNGNKPSAATAGTAPQGNSAPPPNFAQTPPPPAPATPTAPPALAASTPPPPPPAPAAPPAPVAVDPTANWQRQNGYRLNPVANAWELDTPATAPAPAPVAPAAAAAVSTTPPWLQS